MPFLTNSDADIREMLQAIGVQNFEQLIAGIPAELRFKGKLNIPPAISELEVQNVIEQIGARNHPGISFMGGGIYDHYIPAIIDTLVSRSEFYTAYTPYQPEVSQGTLQAIYEFQSMICELTRLDVTNASMYEGGSALAEAMLLACAHTGRKKVLVGSTLNHRYQAVLESYIRYNQIELLPLPARNFQIDLQGLSAQINSEVAAVIVQHPNYFGFLEEVFEIAEMCRQNNVLFIVFYDPLSLGLLEPPGGYGADIAIAEGQALGNRQNFGGPLVGLFSTRAELIRKVPGRLSGLTRDVEGKPGFVLTLQTREQHIRREKATSNICTNSGLLALINTIYLATLGKQGLKEVASLCLQKSHYLAKALTRIKGVSLVSKAPFFKEFTVRLPLAATKVLSALQQDGGIAGGISLDKIGFKNHLLIAVTEKRTKTEMDNYIKIVKKVL
jgi:glycine dehydrogenase subunit 1